MKGIKVVKNDSIGNKIQIEYRCEGLMVAYIDLEKNVEDECYQHLINTTNYLYINEVYVDKGFRRMGLANKLMSKLDLICSKYFPEIEHIVLTVMPMEHNITADQLKAFYEKFGFKYIGQKTMFKNLPIPAPIQMHKFLN